VIIFFAHPYEKDLYVFLKNKNISFMHIITSFWLESQMLEELSITKL